jgi:hypothetical protein
MAARTDNAGRYMAAYLSQCRRDGTRPTRAGAVAYAGADVAAGMVYQTWLRYERMGFLREFADRPAAVTPPKKKKKPKKHPDPPTTGGWL